MGEWKTGGPLWWQPVKPLPCNGRDPRSFLLDIDIRTGAAVNTANLQLEGLLMAIAGINQMLVEKGVLTTEEIDRSLASSEQTAIGDERVQDDLSPANRDAIAFPIRLLKLANKMADGSGVASFQALTRMVGQTKGPYNDQF